ncbi:hypothetical protein Tco_0479150 [Tanacetum coccineum]
MNSQKNKKIKRVMITSRNKNKKKKKRNFSVAAVTPSFATTIPQPHVPIIQTLQQTPDSTTTPNPTTTLPEIPNFASLFGFEQRVSTLETEMSEFKQTSQFAKAVSSILTIVDNYLASKMKDAVDAIIKDQVKAQVSKILSKVEKYVTKSLGAEVLVRSTNQPQTSYAVAASLSEFELKKILIDKIEENKSMNRSDDEDPSAGSNRGSKRRRFGKEAKSSKEPTNKESKSTSSSKVTSRSQPKSSGKSAQAEEHGQKAHNLRVMSFIMSRLKIDNLTQDVLTGPTYDLMEGTLYPHDLIKSLPLILNARGRQVIHFNHFINNDLEYLKGGSLSQRYITSITKTKAADYGHVKWIKDKGPKHQKFYGYAANTETSKDVYSRHMIIAVTSKLTNLNLDERFALNVALRMYTRRIIYQDDMDRNRLMRTEELHKFSDDTLNHVCTAFNDIAIGIQMEYLPKRKWSKQDKQRAHVMINAIDEKLRDKRLMRSLEKFVGGRPYGGDLWLLERTI